MRPEHRRHNTTTLFLGPLNTVSGSVDGTTRKSFITTLGSSGEGGGGERVRGSLDWTLLRLYRSTCRRLDVNPPHAD